MKESQKTIREAKTQAADFLVKKTGRLKRVALKFLVLGLSRDVGCFGRHIK